MMNKGNIPLVNLPHPKFLWFFVLSYSMVTVLANWFAPRLINIFDITTTAGVLIFPLTFLLSDLITEVYGYKHARRAIWCGFLFNALFILYGQIIIRLPSPEFAMYNAEFDALQSINIRIVIASSLSYLCAEQVNSFIVAKMKVRLHGRYMAIRFVLSTVFAAGIDSVVFCIVAFYGLMSNPHLFAIVITMWLIKIIIEIIGLPISIRLTKKLKRVEKLDIYDRKTNFNIINFDANYQTEENEFNSKQH